MSKDYESMIPPVLMPLQPRGWPRPKGFSNGLIGQGRTVFVAGQVGWDATGTFPRAFADQVRQALENILSVLAVAGGEARHIGRMTWYVTDMDAYRDGGEAIGAAYRSVMGRHFPAMTLVEVGRLVEREALVEIEATALLPVVQENLP